MEKLIEQIKEKGFKPITFAIYNYMDEKGYLIEMERQFKTKLEPNDFEYVNFTLTESEKNGLKYRTKSVTDKFNKLKVLLESNCVNNTYTSSKCHLFILKDEKKVFLVKLKDFDITENLSKIK